MDIHEAPGTCAPKVDVSRPHPARVYGYLLGGKDHFAADREVAGRILESLPAARTAVRESRAFMGRAVRFLAAEAGVRQFLDIGTGLPTSGSVHEIAQAVAPSARVAYVDNDPTVLAHARALLTSSPAGRTSYTQVDLRDPKLILADLEIRSVLDFGQPIALVLVAVLHFLPDESNPARIVATLLDALPSGSYLIATHGTMQHNSREAQASVERAYANGGIQAQARDSGEFARLAFAGLDLAPPGVVPVSERRPDIPGPHPTPAEVCTYGGVGRKPLPTRNAKALARRQARGSLNDAGSQRFSI